MAAVTSLWWRRLVNAYEAKADMVCLQCNNCVIHTRALQRRASHNEALYKYIFLHIPLGYIYFSSAEKKHVEQYNISDK